MIKDAVAVAIIAASGLSVATHAGQQITDSSQHLIWLIVASGTGASVAVLFPTQDKTPALRRFAAAFLAAPALSIGAFRVFGLPLVTDLVYAVGAGMAFCAWQLAPLLRKEAIAQAWALIKGGRRNG